MSALRRRHVPHCPDGQRIGLFGGSFDPPHAGHASATLWALKRIDLDRVWWLFSAGNPLKGWDPAPLRDRIAAAHSVLNHPKVGFSDLEARSGTIHTLDTLELLQSSFPSAKFVWLMGSDNLSNFHRWEGWRDIFGRVPIGVLARRPDHFAAMNAVAARTFGEHRITGASMRSLAAMDPPAWALFRMPFDENSSTKLRCRNGQGIASAGVQSTRQKSGSRL